ncbi:hypothetical protein NUW54_g2922 [Trametes sanguinea]|uniref:Uncharacterized protein n=1 Tax=Trametes sanguinea TaxID=158606 RepID=A0ACC1Q3V4_9APHY|nr:hypothetical protein NUW54_g2922 [Trametes sanguinea]
MALSTQRAHEHRGMPTGPLYLPRTDSMFASVSPFHMAPPFSGFLRRMVTHERRRVHLMRCHASAKLCGMASLQALLTGNPLPPPHQPASHVSPDHRPSAPQHGSLVGHHGPPHHSHHPHIQQPFQFSAPDQGVRYDDAHYDTYGSKRLTSSRSSSSSEKSVPRKRSYTTLAPLTTSVEETPYELGSENPGSAMYDEVDMGYGAMDTDGSPIDGSNSGGEQDEQMKPMDGQVPSAASANSALHGSNGTPGANGSQFSPQSQHPPPGLFSRGGQGAGSGGGGGGGNGGSHGHGHGHGGSHAHANASNLFADLLGAGAGEHGNGIGVGQQQFPTFDWPVHAAPPGGQQASAAAGRSGTP